MNGKRKKKWGNNPKFKELRTQGNFSGNRFDLLDEDDIESSDGECETIPPKDRVPPIIVDNAHGFSLVMGLIGKQYKYKRMSIGTKIISETMSLYEDAIKQLKNSKFQFYTHQFRDKKKFKLVLFGLPYLDSKTILDEFKDTHNITPVNVKEIKTKRSSAHDALYIVEFCREEITKREVMKIKYFYGISVYWRNPLKGNRGPTQCSKCSMYGHGANHCHRNNICPACAGNHDYSVCTLSKTEIEGPVIYKCHNCSNKKLKNINHRADDPRCPCRKEYLEIRQRATSHRSFVPQRRVNNASDINITVDNFPQLANHDKLPSTSKNSDYFSRGKKFSDVTNTKHRNKSNNEEDDISNEKLLEIYFDAIDALQQCHNKYDKLRVLGMMLKHAL